MQDAHPLYRAQRSSVPDNMCCLTGVWVMLDTSNTVSIRTHPSLPGIRTPQSGAHAASTPLWLHSYHQLLLLAAPLWIHRRPLPPANNNKKQSKEDEYRRHDARGCGSESQQHNKKRERVRTGSEAVLLRADSRVVVSSLFAGMRTESRLTARRVWPMTIMC
jgi:hypothetical protein